MARPRMFWFWGEQSDCMEMWLFVEAGLTAQLGFFFPFCHFLPNCSADSIDSPAAWWSLSSVWSSWCLLLQALALVVDLITLIHIHGGAGITTAIDGLRFRISAPGSSRLGIHSQPDHMVTWLVSGESTSFPADSCFFSWLSVRRRLLVFSWLPSRCSSWQLGSIAGDDFELNNGSLSGRRESPMARS